MASGDLSAGSTICRPAKRQRVKTSAIRELDILQQHHELHSKDMHAPWTLCSTVVPPSHVGKILYTRCCGHCLVPPSTDYGFGRSWRMLRSACLVVWHTALSRYGCLVLAPDTSLSTRYIAECEQLCVEILHRHHPHRDESDIVVIPVLDSPGFPAIAIHGSMYSGRHPRQDQRSPRPPRDGSC